MTHENTAPAKDEVDRIAMLMFNEWKRVDPCSGVANHPVSYMATFADMARVVLADLSPAVTVKPLPRSTLPQWELDWSFLDKLHKEACSYEDGMATHVAVEAIALAVERRILLASSTTGEREAALREAAKIARDIAFDRDGKGDTTSKMQGATAAVINNAILSLIDTPPAAEPTVQIGTVDEAVNWLRQQDWNGRDLQSTDWLADEMVKHFGNRHRFLAKQD